MGAMPMTYPVKNERDIEIDNGARMSGTVVRVGDDYWVEDVKPEMSR